MPKKVLPPVIVFETPMRTGVEAMPTGPVAVAIWKDRSGAGNVGAGRKTDHVAPVPLLCALVPAALFAVAVQRGVHRWWILLPLAAATWALVHASGIHATVAGVVLGFTVPVLGRHGGGTERLEHLVRLRFNR